MVASRPLPSHISSKCPASPNPVTSVIALTPGNVANVCPALFSLHIWSRARPLCSSASNSRFSAVVKTPMPSGLVRYKRQPSIAVSFRFNLSCVTRPVTASPKTGSGQSMLCPPASIMPASAQTCRPPSTTSAANSGGSLSNGQPRIAIAIRGRPPMA